MLIHLRNLVKRRWGQLSLLGILEIGKIKVHRARKNCSRRMDIKIRRLISIWISRISIFILQEPIKIMLIRISKRKNYTKKLLVVWITFPIRNQSLNTPNKLNKKNLWSIKRQNHSKAWKWTQNNGQIYLQNMGKVKNNRTSSQK